MAPSWFTNREPDPDDLDFEAADDDTGPPFGLSRYHDILAMQWAIIRQHRDIYRELWRMHRNYRRMSLLWGLMALLWIASFSIQLVSLLWH